VQVFSASVGVDVISGNCRTGITEPIPIPTTAPLVGPGVRNHLIASRPFGGPSGCCPGGVCARTTVCDFVAEYSVTTTDGLHFERFLYTITFPEGPSCPACPQTQGGAFVPMCAPE
jgi:hypothetical protein